MLIILSLLSFFSFFVLILFLIKQRPEYEVCTDEGDGSYQYLAKDQEYGIMAVTHPVVLLRRHSLYMNQVPAWEVS